MKLGYTVHYIHRRVDALNPGTVAEFDDAEYAELEAFGAVRVPTDDELALYRMTHPEAEPELPLAPPLSAPHPESSANITEPLLLDPVTTAKPGKARKAVALDL